MKLDCKIEELSRRAASAFIDHLKLLQEGNEAPIVRRTDHANAPLRKPDPKDEDIPF